MLNRRSLLAVAGALAVTHATRIRARSKPSPAATKVLFVCQFGSVKSPISRELLRRKAAAADAFVRVESRGITPEAHLPPQIAERLEAEGIDAASAPLRALTQADLDNADVVVIYDKLPLGLHARDVRDWTDLGSIVSNYDSTRRDLDARLDGLVGQLAPRSTKP